MYEWALTGYRKTLDSDEPMTVAAARELRSIYWKVGKLEDAEAALQRTLRCRTSRYSYYCSGTSHRSVRNQLVEQETLHW